MIGQNVYLLVIEGPGDVGDWVALCIAGQVYRVVRLIHLAHFYSFFDLRLS